MQRLGEDVGTSEVEECDGAEPEADGPLVFTAVGGEGNGWLVSCAGESFLLKIFQEEEETEEEGGGIGREVQTEGPSLW